LSTQQISSTLLTYEYVTYEPMDNETENV